MGVNKGLLPQDYRKGIGINNGEVKGRSYTLQGLD